VAVSTLPGQALDLDVVGASLYGRENLGQPEVVPRTVEDRGAVVLDHPDNGKISGGPRAVLTTTPGGDLVIVAAQGADLPSADELVAVAASVEPATTEEWEDLVDRAQD
jgi:hypothetical protein